MQLKLPVVPEQLTEETPELGDTEVTVIPVGNISEMVAVVPETVELELPMTNVYVTEPLAITAEVAVFVSVRTAGFATLNVTVAGAETKLGDPESVT